MLTRNDTCFFALAFYRQERQEVIRALEQDNLILAFKHAHWMKFWWQEFTSRRAASRLPQVLT